MTETENRTIMHFLSVLFSYLQRFFYLLRCLLTGKEITMGQQAIIPPDYSPKQFVNRKDEINLVEGKARALASGHPVDRRVVIFTGERGTGKSWLLSHLKAELAGLGLIVYLLDLRGYGNRNNPNLVAVGILKQLIAEMGSKGKGPGVELVDMSRNLMDILQPMLVKQAMALLIDQVYESDWELLAVLEDYLLGPLAVEPRVLIVMTGRGRPYPWKIPQLRLKAELVDLEPFPNVSITADQLQRQQKKAVSRAAEIHDCSGGNPLANFLLGAYGNPVPALDQVVEGMLETVPKGRQCQVRDCCEALCVLRSFDEERIPVMLSAYHEDNSYSQWSYAQASKVREELVRWGFAKWDGEQGSYVLDEPTRWLVEQYLKASSPKKWRELHEAACRLYKTWVEEYPQAQSRWQPEANYHRGFLTTGTTTLAGGDQWQR